MDASKSAPIAHARTVRGATVDIDGDAYRGDVAVGLGNSRIDAKAASPRP